MYLFVCVQHQLRHIICAYVRMCVLYELKLHTYVVFFMYIHVSACVHVCNKTIRKIKSFHNHCILGVSRAEQRIRYLTNAQIRIMFGMKTSMKDLLDVYIDLVTQTDDIRIPKRLLFGWFPQPQVPLER